MKAIRTKYLGPSNVKGSRIKATDEDGNSKTIPYDHATAGVEARHAKAAKALVDKLGWGGQWVGGHLKGGMVFVCIDGFRDTDADFVGAKSAAQVRSK